MSSRQEVLNVLLAQSLNKRGIIAAPEQILHAAADHTRHMPDVMVDFQGLRLAIEGDFDGSPGAEQAVAEQTRDRVEQGIAHLGVAVLYPRSLRSKPFAELDASLAQARLRFAVVTEAPDPPSFAEGGLDGLGESLRRAYEQLAKDQMLDRAVNLLRGGIEGFTKALSSQPAVTDRFAHVLGIREIPTTAQRAEEP
jgi:hypothetical protein